MKIHKEIKIDIPEIGFFFPLYNFQSIVNLKLTCCDYSEKNMRLYVIHTQRLPVKPRG